MTWLKPSEWEKQKYIELRLYAPSNEKILLDFNPLKISDEPDWNPMWEEWHCYAAPLRIYQSDYEILLDYFNKIYPTKDAFDGTYEDAFDVCSANWIAKDDWNKIERYIKQDIDNFPNEEEKFLLKFIR